MSSTKNSDGSSANLTIKITKNIKHCQLCDFSSNSHMLRHVERHHNLVNKDSAKALTTVQSTLSSQGVKLIRMMDIKKIFGQLWEAIDARRIAHKMNKSNGHLKHLVALVLREIIAKTRDKNVNEVIAEDFYDYAKYLSNHTKGLSSAILQIFDILFRNPPKTQAVGDFVGSWIRRPGPIINLLFSNEVYISKKSFAFQKCDFHAYNVKRDKWYHSIDGCTFTPSTQTLSDIDNIFKKFNYPTFPTLIEKHQELPYKRPACENYVELSPPRRNRRKIEIDKQENNFEDAQPGHLYNEVPLTTTTDEQLPAPPECIQPEERAAHQLFVVGEAVNVLSKGEPYLAGYISKIEGQDIFIKFPYGRLDGYEYKYDIANILPFQSQFENTTFRPIKCKASRSVSYQRNKIKIYEERLQRSQQNKVIEIFL